MKVNVFDLEGKAVGKMDLPEIFSEKIRSDLIRRAVNVVLKNKRQPYGTDPMAGMRSSAHYHGYRRHRWTMMNREMARMPRLHGKIPPQQMYHARIVPQATGGREAHPPKAEKILKLKINKKERKLAIRSAIAATAVPDLVTSRGHRVSLKELPIVAEDKIQEMKKTREVLEFFKKLGFEKELKRLSERKVRAGRGKSRTRKYKNKIGPLIVITDDKGISKAAGGIRGVNVCRVQNLSAEHLAPGAMPGRLTIFSKSAIEKLKGE